MKKVYVALITPFLDDLSIDYRGLSYIIDDLINVGIDGFIVCGTTGESCTLSEFEKFELLEFVIAYTKGRVELYFGCGSNNTIDTLRVCRKACNYAIDGLLLVTPYYNKPSMEGLYMHYKTIANNITLPIILYQVESRCNCVFSIDILKRLTKECDNIIALKYASKDLKMALKIHQEIPTLILYCGDDSNIKECNEIGMNGIISVIAHIAAKEMISFYREENLLYDFYFKRLANLLFLESSPAGIKYVISKKYPILEKLRLPLVPYTLKNKNVVDAYFDK